MTAPRLRAAIEYEIDGDLRFLSHHDEIRAMMRTLVRAGWPLAYSEGFNPQPRLSLPLPRRVGTASRSQWAIVELCETGSPAPRGESNRTPAHTPRALFDALVRVAPAQIPIRGVTAPLPPGTPHPRCADYECELDPPDAAAVATRIADLLGRSAISVQRSGGPGKPLRTLDVRPLIETIVLDAATLRMRLVFDGQRSARPIEVVTALGLAPAAYEHRVRLARILWDMELAGPNRWPPAPERNTLVEEKNHCHNTQAARPQEKAGSAA